MTKLLVLFFLEVAKRKLTRKTNVANAPNRVSKQGFKAKQLSFWFSLRKNVYFNAILIH